MAKLSNNCNKMNICTHYIEKRTDDIETKQSTPCALKLKLY